MRLAGTPVTLPPSLRSQKVTSPLSSLVVAMTPALLPSSPAPRPSVRNEMDDTGPLLDLFESSRITVTSVLTSWIMTGPSL